MPRLGHFLYAALAVLLLGLGSIASAQLSEAQSDYYKEWLKTADRAEEVVKADRASNAAMDKLRSEISDYRDIFNKARKANTDRIKTLESQLDALGPKPEDGAEEPPDIAALRAHLEDQLDKLRVPRIIAEEAYNRANGLIGEIDRIIRDRQTKLLLERGPTPLNPLYWPEAWTDVKEAGQSLTNEIRTNFKTDIAQEQMRDRAPAILALVLVAIVLIWRGRRWSERVGDYLRALGGGGTGVWSFVVSLFRIVLPWFGVVALVAAVSLTGILGLRGTLLLEQIPLWAATILYFDWIGRQLYLIGEANRFQRLSAAQISELRVHIDLLAVMLVLHGMAVQFEQIENVSDATRAVVGFPLILATAVLLLRIRQIRQRDEPDDDADVRPSMRAAGFNQIVETIRRGLVILGLASPVLAMLGYSNAAEAIVYPTVKTLALIAALVIFQRFVGSVYGWITGKGEAARDSLFYVLVGFALALVALPIMAIYWGAREANLLELWSRLLQGFDIGGVTISPTNFLTFVAVFAIGYVLTRLVQGSLRSSLLPRTKIDPGGQNAIVAGTGYVGIFVAALVAITVAGFDLSSLAIVAGALSVGIGFGLQTIVSNFVSGIILLIERPISKGDWIDVNGMMGYVRDISVRSTRIETFDRTDVIVPNSDLISGVVTNYTRGNTVGRVIVPVGVAYGTDTRKVETILGEIANEHPMVLANPAPSVVFQGFGADSLDFEIRAILRDVNWVLSVKSDMNHEIYRRFSEEGIEIPFAQRDIWIRNPEAFGGAGPESKPETPPPSAPPSSEPAQMTEADLDADGEGDAR
ncbi:mechanosensitive ion channel family protein [Ruegeria sediminis]|uniref:Mechanosensitive ion channel family protein n=1 Tax=Ruegeria sediminis TaxID=2583820 RepID=A0ABY2WW85_9RHOB|nr:DUF3772 domain-containing protein [Ruegeria sediminis]TMV06561.1 mechanosensitive ion channel family protein [Ruegeria sediminis]